MCEPVYMEAHTGKLVEIEMFDNIDIESYLEHIFKDEQKKRKGAFKTWTDYAMYKSGEYHVYKNRLFKIKNHKKIDQEGSIVSTNKDGSVEFTVMFDGSCFNNELNYILNKVERGEE